MSSSAINTQVAQLKIGNVQNQADNSAVYSGGVWSLKNSTALPSVTITDSGNVGIGTASPTQKLQVNGSVHSISGNYHTDTTGGYWASGNNSFATGWFESSGSMVFRTATTERMRIDASGAITLGLAGGNTTHSVFGGIFLNRGTAGTGLSLSANAMPASAGSHAVRWSNVSGAISYDPSSRLLKTDIRDSIYGLNTVLALKPRQYKYIKEEKEDVGFIADEVINIIPEIVSIMPKNQITGISTDEGDEPSTVDYSRLTAVLVKAIQELSAKVDAQAAEIEALKAK